MFGILLVEIQYLCKVRYGFIEPMHRNKTNITYLSQHRAQQAQEIGDPRSNTIQHDFDISEAQKKTRTKQ